MSFTGHVAQLAEQYRHCEFPGDVLICHPELRNEDRAALLIASLSMTDILLDARG
jgi:hypothetical protein